MERFYDINFVQGRCYSAAAWLCLTVNNVTVSTLFIGAFCGFVIAGISNVYLTDRFGMGKVRNANLLLYLAKSRHSQIVSLGALGQTLGYAVILAPPPFALFPVTYALLIGFGLALQMAATVSFVASLPGSHYKLNYAQASYG